MTDKLVFDTKRFFEYTADPRSTRKLVSNPVCSTRSQLIHKIQNRFVVINKSVSVLPVVPDTSSKTGLPRSQLINKSGLSIRVRLRNTMRALENN